MHARQLSQRIGRAVAAAGLGLAATLGLASSAAADDNGVVSGGSGTVQSETSGDVTPDSTYWD